jgi:dolichyl-diphosphooligosaccharide--protein glycosyltransferase
LIIIWLLGFFIRIFSVIRYESIIHEFDPWFNYRVTKVLVEHGPYKFWNYYDHESWHPLGRPVGPTVFPGLMATAGGFHWFSHLIGFPVEIRNVCVFIAPVFSGFCAVATYLFTKEATHRQGPGLFAALFIAIVPSYISRSCAGSYDNEGVSIFALVLVFYLWIKAVNTGSIWWSTLCSLAYFYMVAAWGGYTFIINIIPIYVLGLLFIGKFNMKVYVAYSVFYILGSLFAMQVQFVNFAVVKASEHLASHGVFYIIQVYVVVEWLKQKISKEQFTKYSRFITTSSVILFALAFLYASLTGLTRFSGRSMTLLDPSYAKKYIPIIASVSEHQPTSWASFFFDIQFLLVFMPVGLYFCYIKPTYGMLFCALYGVLSVYFACAMIRLMLVFAPAACVLAGIGVSEVVRGLTDSIRMGFEQGEDDDSQAIEENKDSDEDDAVTKSTPKKSKGKKKGKKREPKTEVSRIVMKYPFISSVVMTAVIGFILAKYVFHSTWVAAEAYSSPSIILASRGRNGEKILIDDYREAYDWIRLNTDPADKIMSWWDYGYQITGMANRTVLADGNTWNNTHIATIGKAFASTEEEGYKIARTLDADYVLIIFGALSYYSGDDISKFIWMIRIAAGVYPEVVEQNFFRNGQYRVDKDATDTMKNSLMYRLAYYRFGEVRTSYQQPPGFDTVRNMAIDPTPIKLKYFTEVYTTQRWLLRIYKINEDPNRLDKIEKSII